MGYERVHFNVCSLRCSSPFLFLVLALAMPSRCDHRPFPVSHPLTRRYPHHPLSSCFEVYPLHCCLKFPHIPHIHFEPFVSLHRSRAYSSYPRNVD
ncbi:hypothetical protein BKA70DRAFT_535049 [Coprinopsis sp. MPI-PUGE-AT-0042]|nr:hypothetical protein BKA70DRAFT_535049 [Coprinopsis sp. MPI-PUGE-AT-0042]